MTKTKFFFKKHIPVLRKSTSESIEDRPGTNEYRRVETILTEPKKLNIHRKIKLVIFLKNIRVF